MLLRATILHTPRDPFRDSRALESFHDGALLVENGRISSIGPFQPAPGIPVHDLRPAIILPGFIDTHVHFPQVRVIGSLGAPLLEWLHRYALPEELRMADPPYAAQIAREFVNSALAHGTTTALVFGAHFPDAVAVLFEEASRRGFRLISGLVLSDRHLIPGLHLSPDQAFLHSDALIQRFHRRHGCLYAVTPRFALSASEPMLEVCGALLRSHPDLRFQTHINENRQEIDETRFAFPWARDYVDVYDRFGLLTRQSVLAHNVHPTARELQVLAERDSAVAHCPCSNAALASGLFPMAQHLAVGLRFGLGTDVGAGSGFGLMKEALQAYLLQQVHPEGYSLKPEHLLYLMTAAGARVLGLDHEIGDFQPGKCADLVCLLPPHGSPLAAIWQDADPYRKLSALLTLAGSESVREVWVHGRRVHENSPPN